MKDKSKFSLDRKVALIPFVTILIGAISSLSCIGYSADRDQQKKENNISSAAPAALVVSTVTETITLNKTNLSLTTGASQRLDFSIQPADNTNGAIYWASSDEKVATVSEGLVTAVSPGGCTVTAETENGETAACKVAVTAPAPVVSAPAPSSAPAKQNQPAAQQAPATVTKPAAKAFQGEAFASSSQVILVTASGMDTCSGRFRTYQKTNGTWSLVMDTSANLGTYGMIYDSSRVEGDNKTPAGLYGLCYAFGWGANPGTKMTYKQTDANSFFDENSGSPNYNRWVEGNPGGNNEWMGIDLYKFGVDVDFNPNQTPNKGSGIFIHIKSPTCNATAGCVAIDEDKIISLLQWLDPAQSPKILICSDGDVSKYYY